MLQEIFLICVALVVGPQALASPDHRCEGTFRNDSGKTSPELKLNEQVLITYDFKTRRSEGTHFRVLTVRELHRDARDNIVSFYGLDGDGTYQRVDVGLSRVGRAVNEKSQFKVSDLVGWYVRKSERQGRVQTLREGRITSIFDTGTAVVEASTGKISFIKLSSLTKRLSPKVPYNGLTVGNEVMRVQSIRTRRAVIETVYRGYVMAIYADGATVIENDIGRRDSGPAENYKRVEN